MTFHPDTLPTLKGKVFIVTSGNSGIGYYTVSHLAEHGAHVYMCARSPKKGTEAITNIKKTYPLANIDLLQIDLTRVVAAAKHFLALETSLHSLVNNAGIMATPFEMTKDGHKAKWQTIYLSHWVSTEHLLPLMLRTSKTLSPGSVRIVNLTSSGHLIAPKGGINWRTCRSKIAAHGRATDRASSPIFCTPRRYIRRTAPAPPARKGEGEIWVSSVHPGMVETNLATSVWESGSSISSVISVMRMVGLIWPADKGSWTSLYCAASRNMKAEQSGTYMEISKRFGEPRWQSGASKDE
ncbi:hypothetical protein GMDG_02972 [Pseudogymnoascus destructans 20631-21]|uniref:NAD(P)-binding protein n=2 Tax=Pseudogymnoascus destructans TaxID=655981 RepID=L8G4G4_PSED2|nr:hypothetical protein GMDG_02972 [Pseudogymnoascus destructans 20631-21]